MHGGQIQLISAPGKGSELIISLPVQLTLENETTSLLDYQTVQLEKINIEFSDI